MSDEMVSCNLFLSVSDLSMKRTPFDIAVGDRVRVKPSVVIPTQKWGSVTHISIGVVKSEITD